MMLAADFLSCPIELKDDIVNVLCIENKELYRNIVRTLIEEKPEAMQIVFSEDYAPVKFKGNICFVDDYYRLSVSSGTVKKLYENISAFCERELFSETAAVKAHLVGFMDSIIESYDFDFVYEPEVSLSELFKMLELKPDIASDDLLQSLLDYILLINKYSSVKCFVLLNLHLFFNTDELESFFQDLQYNHISILLLENSSVFEKTCYEKIRIIDDDLCEIY